MSTPLLGHRYFVTPEDGPGDGGTLCQLIDRTNVFTADHWEALPMRHESTTRVYDEHYLRAAGDDLPHVWTEEEKAALWEKALVWSAGILLGLAFWYGTVVLLASLWRRVFS